MKLSEYLKDHLIIYLICILTYLLILMILIASKVELSAIIFMSLIILAAIISIIAYDYLRKRRYYNVLLLNIERLDEAYLVNEIIDHPEFYEGQILESILYDINKSMIENVNKERDKSKDFRDYIELWIHEVKIPLASLVLSINNHNYDNHKLKLMIKHLEDSIDRVLYYVRSDNAANDYLISGVELSNVIKNISIKNMDDILDNNIDFKVSNVNYKIYTDSKWLEFIINQIINNSIKYKKKNNSYINISAIKENDLVILTIEDNGIGISEADLKQVFNKTFTGSNGHDNSYSTGMGLYIVKNLIDKLGHQINIESKINEYTKVKIIFSINNHYLRY